VPYEGRLNRDLTPSIMLVIFANNNNYIITYRLQAMTRTLPQYAIRWNSQIVRANTRVSGPTISPVHSAGTSTVIHVIWTCISMAVPSIVSK